MTVASWTGVTYTNSFTPKKAYIGNYYYNDGSWGSVVAPTDGRTTIGIVFSTTTSTTDKAKGWTHGYAMAVTNAQNTGGVMWSPNNVTELGGSFTNTVALMTTNLDGYTESQTIKTKAGSNPNLLTNYPAFYYALNYGTSGIGGTSYAAPIGTNNSGWYLPSIGQWYLIVKNLGGITTAPTDGGIYGYWTNPSSFNAASAINVFLNNVTSSNQIDCVSSTRVFWCSSEWSSSHACSLNFYGNDAADMIGNLLLDYDSSKGKQENGSGTRVRSVIAF
jgi:hypothetical protein